MYLRIVCPVFGLIFAFLHVMSFVLSGLAGPLELLVFAISGVGEFALIVMMTALSLFFFFMSAVVWFGTTVIDGPFEIDAETGTTTDAFGRRWVRERHGPAKVTSNKLGPLAIIFPAFGVTEGAAAGPPPPTRIGGPTRRFLQRGFARFCGARGAEFDGLILPVGYLSDRKAIMAAIKPEPPRFRWW